MYKSPSQSKDEFESFADKLELNLDSVALRKPYFIIVLSNFDAQTKQCFPLRKTAYEGTRNDGITSQVTNFDHIRKAINGFQWGKIILKFERQ